MWPLPRLNKTCVLVTFHPHVISLSWIERLHRKAPLRLCAYKRIVIKNCALENLVLFNPIFVQQSIEHFLRIHRIRNSFIICSLAGPPVNEQFIAVDTATPGYTDFFSTFDRTVQYGYHYMYPNDSGHFVFYVYTIPHTILFQYKLLAIRAALNCIKIVPHRVAYLNMYQFLHGTAFRHAQLAIDMMRHNNMIEHFFTQDSLCRIIDVSGMQQLHDQDMLFVLNAAGLFISQEGSL